MQKYEVRLQSTTDDQSRIVTLSDVNPERARIRAERLELEACEYDMNADPYLSQEDVSRIGSTNYSITKEGKVRGPNKRWRGKLHQHMQQVPYEVVSVEAVNLDERRVQRLVEEIMKLQDDPEAWKAALKQIKDKKIPLAAVTGFLYGVPVKNQYDGTAVSDWDTDTIKCALTTVTYTEDQDTHDFFNDVTNEVSGTGYTAGGATLGSKTATYDTASDQTRLDAADTTWTTSTITARKAIVYKSTGTASTSPLIGLLNFGADVSTTGGTFQITWDSTGIQVIDVT